MVDHFSKFLIAYPLKDKKAERVSFFIIIKYNGAIYHYFLLLIIGCKIFKKNILSAWKMGDFTL